MMPTKSKKKPVKKSGANKSATLLIKPEIINREHWLNKAADAHIKLLEDVTGNVMPKFNISCGWPSRGALSMSKPVIGQCWDGYISDGVAQLFISPRIADPTQVAATVAHELIHNAIGTKCGHRGKFPATATAIGLVGKPTATYAGEDYKKWVDPILKKLGGYPHSIMSPSATMKTQTTRLHKASCTHCHFSCRVTKQWLVQIEQWSCPLCSQPMEYPKFEE